MKCTIEIDMGNAAFEDEWELARILTELAERTKAAVFMDTPVKLYDINGNHVGQMIIEEV